jgi:hypothetical protein
MKKRREVEYCEKVCSKREAQQESQTGTGQEPPRNMGFFPGDAQGGKQKDL